MIMNNPKPESVSATKARGAEKKNFFHLHVFESDGGPCAICGLTFTQLIAAHNSATAKERNLHEEVEARITAFTEGCQIKEADIEALRHLITFGCFETQPPSGQSDVKGLEAEWLTRLMDYAEHAPICKAKGRLDQLHSKCDCGLRELLKKVEAATAPPLEPAAQENESEQEL